MTNINSGYALVVDDEYNKRSFAEKLLQAAGLKVCTAATALEAIALAQEYPDLTLAVIDYELPGMTGIELIHVLRRVAPHVLPVMATVHDDQVYVDAAFEAGAICYLVKPNGFIELYHALKKDGQSTILSGEKRYVIDNYGPHVYRGHPASAPVG